LASTALEKMQDPFVGDIRAAYWGWAKDPEICSAGVSGGIVTAILCRLLETGEVDAALLTRWDPQQPLRPQPFLARSADEVRGAQKSKYCMVALNKLGREIAEARQQRIAVVGLACHLHGLVNMAERFPAIGEKVVLRIGLFCDRTLSYHVSEKLIASSGLGTSEVRRFEYRQKGPRGWPGDVYIEPEHGDPLFLDRKQRMILKDAFTPVRCRLCFDKFNVLSDIACGDGYGAPSHSEGTSALLVRTQAGEEALEQVRDCLALNEAEPAAVLRHHQKRDMGGYLAAFAELCPGVPTPLPEVCARSIGTPSDRNRARHLRELRWHFRFENATDEKQAHSMARTRLLKERLHRIPPSLRGRAAQVVKGLLKARSS